MRAPGPQRLSHPNTARSDNPEGEEGLMAQPAPCEMLVRGSGGAAGPSLAWPMAPAGEPTAVVARQRPIEPFEAITAQECHRAFATNVLGPILEIQEALQHVPASGGSSINISSIASEHPVPHSSLYAATKGAIDTRRMALAKELGPRNIRVNAVAPGHTETEGTRRIGLVDSAQAQQMVAATPLVGRFGRPEDIALVVVFLASGDAAWVTGERISASGGAR